MTSTKKSTHGLMWKADCMFVLYGVTCVKIDTTDMVLLGSIDDVAVLVELSQMRCTRVRTS